MAQGLNPEEQVRLLRAATVDQSPLAHCFVMMVLHSELRHAEIINLLMGDIDLKGRQLWVRKETRRVRSREMGKVLADYLRPLVKGKPANTYLFASADLVTGRISQMTPVLRRCAARAGIRMPRG
jgi:integrase